eukprot:m.2890 g.2890  ORF g.2890 m.2890 type:complete len:442 (+) comp8951_c0_seq1:58-1383(+)
MKNLSLLATLVLLFFRCNFAASATSPPAPPAATTDTCKALQKATAATGLQCSTNQDCTTVTCQLKPLPSLSTSITISFSLKKCQKPLEVFMYINVPIAQYKYSYAFEGSQTIPIPNVPAYLSIFIGTPYAHVQIEAVPGGVNMSAGVWFKQFLSSTYTRYSVIREQFIPLDVSACPSMVTSTLPSKWADFHDYSNDYDSDTIADVVKKWLGLLHLFPTKRTGVVPSGAATVGPTRGSVPVLGSLPTDINQLMKLSPALKKCVDAASKKIFGVTYAKLQLVQRGIIPKGFKIPADSDDGVDEFTQAAVVCGVNYAVAGSFSQTEMPSESLDDMLEKLADNPKITDCASEVLKTYGIDIDMIPSEDSMETLDIERDLLQCFYGPTEADKNDGGVSMKWIIIGASVGGAILIAVIVIIVLFVVYMKRRVPAASGVSYRQLEMPS